MDLCFPPSSSHVATAALFSGPKARFTDICPSFAAGDALVCLVVAWQHTGGR